MNLKPCPFCGNKIIEFRYDSYEGEHYLECTACHTRSGACISLRTEPPAGIVKELTKRWNRRGK